MSGRWATESIARLRTTHDRGRARQDRRIAITLLPEELAGADAPPAGQTNSVTAVPLPPQAPIVSRPTAETNRVPAAVDE